MYINVSLKVYLLNKCSHGVEVDDVDLKSMYMKYIYIWCGYICFMYFLNNKKTHWWLGKDYKSPRVHLTFRRSWRTPRQTYKPNHLHTVPTIQTIHTAIYKHQLYCNQCKKYNIFVNAIWGMQDMHNVHYKCSPLSI